MSFRCQHCNTVQESGTIPHKTVTEQRMKIYPKRYSNDGETVLDQGGKGLETVSEIDLCDKCAKKQEKHGPVLVK